MIIAGKLELKYFQAQNFMLFNFVTIFEHLLLLSYIIQVAVPDYLGKLFRKKNSLQNLEILASLRKTSHYLEKTKA